MKRNIFVRLTAMALLIVMIVPALIACEPLDSDNETTAPVADPTEAPDITGEPDVTTDAEETTEAATYKQFNTYDTQMLSQELMHTHHISHSNKRKVAIPRLSRLRINRKRARSTIVRAEEVGTHYKISLWVEKTSLLHGMRPPLSTVRVSSQGVADPDDIALIGIHRAVGIISNIKRREGISTLRCKRLRISIYFTHGPW